MKKVLSIVLSIAMVVCLAPTMAFAGTTTAQVDAAYSDIAGTPCEGAVNVLSALGVVDGFTDGTYKPEQTVTRAQMAKLVVTALGLADYATATTSKFVDMGTATWAIPYVEYASNLNIVNGVGNGKFNPNGLVTYEQAATMIVRALGYTDECKEMNGTWPAIYIQKAMALGIFDGVVNGGANGANRGDVAIMLYNALDVKQVYADNDGATQEKKSANNEYLTMMKTLNANGDSEYKIVTDTDAEVAVNNISGYIGAAAQVVTNKDGDVLALSDIKTQFLTGEIKSNGKFEADNGTTYTIANDAYKVFADTEKGTVKSTTYVAAGEGTAASGGVPAISNNVVGSNRGPITYAEQGNNKYTLAVTISGKTITGIYSVATWTVEKAEKVDDSDLNQITKNKKLLTYKFALDNDQEIDITSFILNGVASLSDIKADNIVSVYVSGNEIKRVDVGTKTVTGKITKVSDNKYTIDGVAYKLADKHADNVSDLKAGNEVTISLDYSGKIYDVELVDGNAGNFAVVLALSTDAPENSSVSGTAKVELLTAEGAKVFAVNAKKYEKSEDDNITWAESSVGTIVKYSVNDDGEITKLIDMTNGDEDYEEVVSLTSATDVTKAGYFNGSAIADNALIFAVPGTNSFNWDADTDDFSVVQKSAILNTEVQLAQYIVDKDTNKIVLMIIDNKSTSDTEYGIVTSTYDIEDEGTGVDFYIGTEEITNAEVEGTKPDTVKVGGALYEVKKNTSGKYTFKSTDVAEVTFNGDTVEGKATTKADTVKNGYVQLTENGAKFNLYSNVIVYVYDIADKEYSIGSTSDLTDDTVASIKLYSTSEDKNDEDFGLVNYIVVTMN